MARVTEWRRFQAPGASALHSSAVSLASLAPGETLTRCRLHIDVNSLNTNEYVWASVPIVWGLMLVTQVTGVIPDPFAGLNNQEWLWWEGISLRNQPAQGVGAAKYVDSGPDGGGYRDVKAMRKADPVHGSFLYFCIAGSPLVPTLTFFTAVTSSTLVTLP